mmetsp:Transcript_14746/g.32589  ORF Transcript_14746/g.32589 Transcript_14746/m.32589 type:complete len:204 (+) Transcript_14746:102-713(+)
MKHVTFHSIIQHPLPHNHSNTHAFATGQNREDSCNSLAVFKVTGIRSRASAPAAEKRCKVATGDTKLVSNYVGIKGVGYDISSFVVTAVPRVFTLIVIVVFTAHDDTFVAVVFIATVTVAIVAAPIMKAATMVVTAVAVLVPTTLVMVCTKTTPHVATSATATRRILCGSNRSRSCDRGGRIFLVLSFITAADSAYYAPTAIR